VIALDTNVVLSVLNTAEEHHERSRAALIQYLYVDQQDGWISPVVYAELRAGGKWSVVNHWLERANVDVRWDMSEAVWTRAAEAYGQYVQLRRRGVVPRRIVADFLIAAHAEEQGSAVLTYDDTVFRAVFPAVALLAL
jgi:predicted nucleic acid-binding protein